MTARSLIAPARLARAPVLATQSDERLVDLVRAGHESAFETVVARYRGPLLRYAEGFLPRDRAEDAVQQAFVRAYDAMLRDDTELDLRPWLYRIVHNTALNSLRDRALAHGELPEDFDGVEQPDQALERTQGLREVLGAVAALPSRQRDAILLRELEGRSYDEIASVLGVSGGAVRQLLNRARNTLRAAATSVVPIGLLSRLPWTATSEPVAARVAEWSAAAGAGALATKVCATALVSGAIVGGAAVAPDGGDERATAPGTAAAEPQPGNGARPPATAPSGSTAGSDDRSGHGGGRRENDRSGPGGGGDSGREERSGERHGGDDRQDRSGHGGGRSGSDEHQGDDSGPRRDDSGADDSSGPGSGDDDLPEPGPAVSTAGAASSGSGSSGPGSPEISGSGSGSPGSGNSGPGSGDSGSGDSGSENSGSGGSDGDD
jgi:RNA polymerase sigma factor (sigma-70 family)